MKNFNSYYETVKYLESLNNLSDVKIFAKDQKPDYYLKKTKYFLKLLGNPQNKFKFVHIAGTSGKGSTANLIHYILYKNGYRSGLFTSPYTTTSIEKIKVDNLFISTDEFCDIVEFLKPFIDKTYLDCPYGPVSYFEIFLAIALEYFRRQKCKWVVLEAGLGGKYDATNIIENPVVTAITSIDLDHTAILGNTLTKITKDKAGIIKKNSLFFTTEKRPHLLKILGIMVKEAKAKKIIKIKGSNEEMTLAIAKEIGMKAFPLVDAPKLPCRFEIMQQNPLVILDGAHNPSKINYSLEKLKKIKYDKLIMVIAIAEDKDHKKIIEELAPLADEIFFTRFLITQRECASPKNLLKIYRKNNPKGIASVFLDPFMALATALKKAKNNDAVFIAGSFFLAGDLRKHWKSEEWVLDKRAV